MGERGERSERKTKQGEKKHETRHTSKRQEAKQGTIGMKTGGWGTTRQRMIRQEKLQDKARQEKNSPAAKKRRWLCAF